MPEKCRNGSPFPSKPRNTARTQPIIAYNTGTTLLICKTCYIIYHTATHLVIAALLNRYICHILRTETTLTWNNNLCVYNKRLLYYVHREKSILVVDLLGSSSRIWNDGERGSSVYALFVYLELSCFVFYPPTVVTCVSRLSTIHHRRL